MASVIARPSCSAGTERKETQVGDRPPRTLGVALDEPYNAEIIVPLVKRRVGISDDFIELPAGDTPISEELVGELLVMYAFDLPGRFDFVAPRHCKELGIDVGTLRELSVRNLTKRRPGQSSSRRTAA